MAAKSVKPKQGMAVVFNHDLKHSGEPVLSGSKYIVKTEIIFLRTDTDDSFPLVHELISCFHSGIDYFWLSYSIDQEKSLYEQAKGLYDLSDKLEKEKDVIGSTAAYLEAQNIHLNCAIRRIWY